MSDKQKAIDEVSKAGEFINAGNNFAAIEHAEKAMKLDPSVTGAYDMMGIASLKLASHFSGTPDSEKYEKRSLAAFKQAARMGSKSAMGQLAHLGIKWEYPRCATCGGYADPETDIEVLVKCKCGVDVGINRSSVKRTQVPRWCMITWPTTQLNMVRIGRGVCTARIFLPLSGVQSAVSTLWLGGRQFLLAEHQQKWRRHSGDIILPRRNTGNWRGTS
jgi:hypothetical protein